MTNANQTSQTKPTELDAAIAKSRRYSNLAWFADIAVQVLSTFFFCTL